MANNDSGRLLFAFVLAGLLAIACAWLIAALYRRRVKLLMGESTGV